MTREPYPSTRHRASVKRRDIAAALTQSCILRAREERGVATGLSRPIHARTGGAVAWRSAGAAPTAGGDGLAKGWGDGLRRAVTSRSWCLPQQSVHRAWSVGSFEFCKVCRLRQCNLATRTSFKVDLRHTAPSSDLRYRGLYRSNKDESRELRLVRQWQCFTAWFKCWCG